MKFLFIICALLLSTMARAQTGAEINVQKHLSALRDSQSTRSNEATAYSFGMVYGFYVQGKNEFGGDLAETLLSTQDQLKLSITPSLDSAVYALNQFESGLSDVLFCLYKGIATGNYLAGKENESTILAMSGSAERLLKTCK